MTVNVPAGAVVVGVDGTAKDQRALDWAVEEARRREAPLHLLHALPMSLSAYADVGMALVEDMRSAAERVVAEIAATVTERGLEVTTEVVDEPPADALVAASAQAALVVVGARGLGPLASRLRGSVSQKVAAHAAGPVVVVRQQAGPADGPVVVGYGADAATAEVLRFAFTQARHRGVRVRVVHASSPPPVPEIYAGYRTEELWATLADREREETRAGLRGVVGEFDDVPYEHVEVVGHPVDAIVEHSVDAGLVVVGSRSRRGLAAVRLGSVSRGVLQQVPTVAVVRVRPEHVERQGAPRPVA